MKTVLKQDDDSYLGPKSTYMAARIPFQLYSQLHKSLPNTSQLMFHFSLPRLLDLTDSCFLISIQPTTKQLPLTNLLSDLPYLSHLERFLMFHTSLETKAPRRSTGQCYYHFLCNHCSVVSVFFKIFLLACWLLPLLLGFFISPGGPQYLGPIVSGQGPHREL